LLREVELVPEPTPVQIAAARRLVVDKDAWVLAAALAAGANVLVTGDLKHFGALMERDDLPLRVRSPRAFLLEGP
jgi:predicted nucleic acid-binding protein